MNANMEVPKADAFLSDLIAVFRKHGLALGHEDRHGGFIVEPLEDRGEAWVMEASVSAKLVAASSG